MTCDQWRQSLIICSKKEPSCARCPPEVYVRKGHSASLKCMIKGHPSIDRDQFVWCSEPSLPAIITTCPTKRYNNRYGHLNGLETMEELAEETEQQPTGSVTSRRSRGHPSFECMSTEVAETDVTIQSSSNGRRNGEVASTSETKTCGAARSSERSRPCDKIPPPARPNTPQRRAASQPSTPRKIHVTPQVLAHTVCLPAAIVASFILDVH